MKSLAAADDALATVQGADSVLCVGADENDADGETALVTRNEVAGASGSPSCGAAPMAKCGTAPRRA